MTQIYTDKIDAARVCNSALWGFALALGIVVLAAVTN